MIKYTIVIVSLLAIFTSCSPRLHPFTASLNDSFEWSEDDIKQVQFYLSKDIILTREVGHKESEIIDGNIHINKDRRIEEIIFRKGTPGVILFTPKYDKFAVSFENDEDTTESRFLMFGPSDKAGGRFVLLAKKWNRRSGEISYDNKIYTTGSQSAFASLLVDLKKAKKYNFNRTKVSGRTVSD